MRSRRVFFLWISSPTSSVRSLLDCSCTKQQHLKISFSSSASNCVLAHRLNHLSEGTPLFLSSH